MVISQMPVLVAPSRTTPTGQAKPSGKNDRGTATVSNRSPSAASTASGRLASATTCAPPDTSMRGVWIA